MIKLADGPRGRRRSGASSHLDHKGHEGHEGHEAISAKLEEVARSVIDAGLQVHIARPWSARVLGLRILPGLRTRRSRDIFAPPSGAANLLRRHAARRKLPHRSPRRGDTRGRSEVSVDKLSPLHDAQLLDLLETIRLQAGTPDEFQRLVVQARTETPCALTSCPSCPSWFNGRLATRSVVWCVGRLMAQAYSNGSCSLVRADGCGDCGAIWA